MIYEVFSLVFLLEVELLFTKVNVKFYKIKRNILNRPLKNLVHNLEKVEKHYLKCIIVSQYKELISFTVLHCIKLRVWCHDNQLICMQRQPIGNMKQCSLYSIQIILFLRARYLRHLFPFQLLFQCPNKIRLFCLWLELTICR